jgi:hypothetical protein
MTHEMARSIVSTPLRNLSNEQLTEYTNSAHEWSDQFLYLLPRYMELIAQGQRPTDLDAEHIFWRFRFAPTPCMTSSETAAFDEYLLALFESTLCGDISPDELECALNSQDRPSWSGFGVDVCDVIELAIPTPFDTALFQTLWNACEAQEASLRLVSAISFGIGATRFRRERPLSGPEREAKARWHEWFTLADHTEKLIKAFDRESDPRVQAFILSVM